MEFEVRLPKEKTTIWDNYVPILKSTDGRYKAIYITDAFTSPNEYNEACFELRTCQEGDKVDIFLNSPGGYTGSAFMLVDAMKQCKAHITGKLSGEVASAATVITMYCDDIEVADETHFMCHNYSHGTAGSGAQVKEYVNFVDKEFVTATKKIYEGFLTPKEMESISKQDKEIWLNKDEVLERWANKQAYIAQLRRKAIINDSIAAIKTSNSEAQPVKKRGRPAKKD